MRASLSDSSEDEEYAPYPYESEEYDSSESSTKPLAQPRTALGRSIRAAVYDDSSEEEELEIDSEDEVEMMGDVESLKWTAIRKPTRVTQVVAESSKSPWRRTTEIRRRRVMGQEPNLYEEWLRRSEEESMQKAFRQAQERNKALREVGRKAKEDYFARKRARETEEQADVTRMLEAMAIKQKEEQEEMVKSFAERQKRLWANVEAAIATAERKEQERRDAIEAEKKKKQEEAIARAAEKEKEAKARREQAERLAREHVENEQRKKDEGERRRAEEEQGQREAEAAARAKSVIEDKEREDRDRPAAEWRLWVGKQRWMKTEVIEPVKSDRATRTSLRTGMRLMTRGLGQVVNTKESVLRVTADLHSILCEQLPGEPSAANAVTLEEAPRPYAYLLSHMSKALLKQAESEVSANTDAAYPLGRVIVGLLLRGHAAFGEVLYARFVKKCPWAVPFYPTRGPDQPRDEYEQSTGRGVDESLADYIARMTGILTLYFAIVQTPIESLVPALPAPPTPEQLVRLVTVPLRFTAAWTWLAHALRDPLAGKPPVAGMVLRWAEMLGAQAAQTWGQGQVGKIFVAVEREGIRGGRIKGDSESTRQQLSMRVGALSSLTMPAGRQWEL